MNAKSISWSCSLRWVALLSNSLNSSPIIRLYRKFAYYNELEAKNNGNENGDEKNKFTLARIMTNEPHWKGPDLLIKSSFITYGTLRVHIAFAETSVQGR
ncbi:hypothetical protein RIF29_27073 [Crotalaria pallida]|uniref:Uncharacterized protein n=1 Tax=Crotalaria pallida TaxID=3830 RepID=A0AAN9EQR9_CROPI